MMVWWNDSYLFRRNLQLSSIANLPQGHLATLTLAVDNLVGLGKVRSDFADMQMVFLSGTTWLPIPTLVNQVGANLTITFNISQPLTTVSLNQYYLYYGNLPLVNHPLVIPYKENPWPFSIAYDSPHVTYTKPGQDWIDGTTSVVGARAVLRFAGAGVQVIGNVGPNQGFATLQIDKGPLQSVDFYNQIPLQKNVFQETLAPTMHTLRITKSNRRNPAAAAALISLAEINYLGYVDVVDQGEEVAPILNWSVNMGGA